jgi:predicted Zn-dependent protease
MATQVAPSRAEALLNEFKTRFPDDSSILFSDFAVAVDRDDAESAARLIDAVYKAVEGDDYLLWYKVRLLAAAGKNRDALKVLTEMKTRYQIPVDTLAESELPDDFLSSSDYKTWARSQQPIRTSH